MGLQEKKIKQSDQIIKSQKDYIKK